ncbi:MAG: hypothetical protein P0120_08385 [Nitrospira sp.]|nr:hypothetical protein [Nitrospira sp.]
MRRLWVSYWGCGENNRAGKKAIAENRRAYVIIDNQSEGNAPLTIQALLKALQG